MNLDSLLRIYFLTLIFIWLQNLLFLHFPILGRWIQLSYFFVWGFFSLELRDALSFYWIIRFSPSLHWYFKCYLCLKPKSAGKEFVWVPEPVAGFLAPKFPHLLQCWTLLSRNRILMALIFSSESAHLICSALWGFFWFPRRTYSSRSSKI